MVCKNYKSDIHFLMGVTDAEGTPFSLAGFDWSARIWAVNPSQYVVASCLGGSCENCFLDPEGKAHIVIDSPQLGTGEIQCELRVDIPDSNFPDGVRTEYTRFEPGIRLVDGAGDTVLTPAIEALVTVMKGDTGKDLTIDFSNMSASDKALVTDAFMEGIVAAGETEVVDAVDGLFNG